MEISRQEIRSTIRFLFLEGNNPTSIHQRMLAVYGNSSPSYTTVKEWTRRFKCGVQDLNDQPRPGAPQRAVCPENVEKVEEALNEDRRKTVQAIALEVGISYGSIRTILHDHLGCSKKSARWVPRLLQEHQKAQRVEMCKQLLALWDADPENFPSRIVTGDESWFHHYDPETKEQSKEWRKKHEGAPIKARVQKSAGKVLATIFWDASGILLEDYLEKGRTINAVYYVGVLDRLRYNIKNRRRGSLSQGLFLLHDNAPAHTAKKVKAAISRTCFTELPHPPYSPDLAPSDFYLFPRLKKHLKGRRFQSNNEVVAEARRWFEAQPKEFYLRGIMMLRDRAIKCIQLEGDYVEKVKIISV